MKIKEICTKILVRGPKWFIRRSYQELINPTYSFVKIPIDLILRFRKYILGVFKKKRVSDLLYAIYDLEISPITFNIVEYLCVVEVAAKNKNKEGFVIVLVPKKEKEKIFVSDYDRVIDKDSIDWRISNVIIQSLPLHPKCRGFLFLPDRKGIQEITSKYEVYPELYDGINLRYADFEEFRKAATQPGAFEGLKASNQGKKYIQQYLNEKQITKKIVTIVLRQYDYDKPRNSNLDEWSKFASYLIANNYHPIIIPDTDNAYNKSLPFDEKFILTDCCWNVQLRMALYESSLVSFSVSGGAGAIMLFNPRCNCILLNLAPKDSSVATLEAHNAGGFYWKFLPPNQKVSFLPDTFENIKSEFEKYIKENLT